MTGKDHRFPPSRTSQQNVSLLEDVRIILFHATHTSLLGHWLLAPSHFTGSSLGSEAPGVRRLADHNLLHTQHLHSSPQPIKLKSSHYAYGDQRNWEDED